MGRIRKISEQTLWQILGRVVSTVVSIVTLGFITRSLGVSNTGVYTLALAYLAFFNLLADLGINAHIVPFLLLPKSSLEWRKFLGLRIFLSILLLAFSVILILFWPGLDPLFKVVVLAGNGLIMTYAIHLTTVAFFQSRLRYDLSALTLISSSLFTLMIIYLVLELNLGVLGVMFAQLSGSVVMASLALILVGRFIKLSPIFNFSYMAGIFKNSWPLALTMIVNMVYFRLDAFILKFYKSFAEVGVYNVAYQIFQAALFIPGYIMNSAYPLLISDFNENKNKFLANLKKSMFIMTGLSFVSTTFAYLLAPFIISVITGNHNFTGSVSALRILSLSFPAFFLTSILMWVQIIFKKYKTLLLIYLLGFSVNALANFIFIPRYSYLAASWITVMSEYLILVVQAAILIPALRKKDL
ncbi:MAG: Heteropolysaccharide repeat unit export protein [Candidatus Daviesbacteria bacterium GW2011_GWB1_41_5]|uniref:Heteropolysaccharide repeat unit export protein n=1 Tax=Candidatus Daviesbacteria bacterium GW2011_GWB1_41_5 TaxID=1618429 RepID=A0A0G0WEA6_9BACT|nr:MAG: Heteropolysaccharide repeat unit export protein [Candidatus Daviesbacteria bacterium GW2011_GWB1_41_5]